MPRVIITTTSRKSNPDQASGYLYVFDVLSEKILHKCPIIEPPFRDVDPNPRGGLRGGKGIAICRDEIFFANSVAVFRFDKNWNLVKVITHPSCSGIHDILIDSENNLWVTSTRNDLLFRFDLEGNLLSFVNFRNIQMLRDSLEWRPKKRLSDLDILDGAIDFRDPRTHILTDFNRSHVNNVVLDEDGKLLISLGLISSYKFAAFVRSKYKLILWGIWPTLVQINQMLIKMFSLRKDLHSDLVVQPAKGRSVILRMNAEQDLHKCLVIDDISVPSHSIMPLSDRECIYLNTTAGDVVRFDLDTKKVFSSTHVTEDFLRGIYKINDEQVLLGSQNNLLIFDTRQNKVLKRILLTEEKSDAVFAIHELPNDFSLPPVSFEEQVGRMKGFDGRKVVFGG